MGLEKVEKNGVIMIRSCLVRPSDPNEDKYRLARVAPPPRSANLNEAVLLVSSSLDPRPPIFNQGNMGSCASCATCMAATIAENLRTRKTTAKLFNPAPVYYFARAKHGWQTQDTGSYIADNCDLVIDDGPLLTAEQPYNDNYQWQWSRAAWDDGKQWNYIQAHQPYYNNLLEYTWLALAAGKPVVLGSYWPDGFFRPVGGRIQEGLGYNPAEGAHAFVAWGYTPGYVLCDNTWSSAWSRDAATFGHHLRAGGFALPASYFATGHVFEGRAISPEPVDVEPEPAPPEPTGEVVLTGLLKKSTVDNLILVPEPRTAETTGVIRSLHRKRGRVRIETI